MVEPVTARRSAGGFTLVELLIVVAIMVMLVGLLMPALSKARSQGRRIVCLSNLRQISIALAGYAAEHGQQAPAAAPQELGGATGRVAESDPWLPPRMFGGAQASARRPLNRYVRRAEVFESPCDAGEPLWWFDTADWQATSTAYELYGSSYFYASGHNRIGGVMAPMGIAKFVGPQGPLEALAGQPLPMGRTLRLTAYRHTSRKVTIGSIPIHRAMTGLVAPNPRGQWYRPDPDHLWANAAFVDGHAEFVQVFAYEPAYASVNTVPSENHPYY